MVHISPWSTPEDYYFSNAHIIPGMDDRHIDMRSDLGGNLIQHQYFFHQLIDKTS